MTGTGTQDDPYIVDNWADFVTALGKSNAYIAFDPNAENKIIDFNEVNPEGITSSIKIAAADINGNGWVIKNLYSNVNLFTYGSNSQKTFHDISFINFYLSGALFYYNSLYNNADLYLLRCRFSGIMTASASLLLGVDTSSKTIQINRCSFNLQCMKNNFTLIKGRYCYLNFCNVKIKSEASFNLCYKSDDNNNTYFIHDNLFNLNIKGDFAIANYSILSDSNVFLGNVVGTVSGDYADDSAHNVYDKTNLTFTANSFYGCTPEQLQNAEYLSSIGFPIGVD